MLSESWHLPERDVRVIESSLRTVIGPPAVFGAASLPLLPSAPLSGELHDFAFAPLLFGEALAAGWPWALAMRLFAGLRQGRSYDGGLGFIPERGKQSPPPPPGGGWHCGTISSTAEPDVVVSVFFDDAGVGLVRCTRAIFGCPSDVRGPVPAWLERSRSRFLPDYIRLELDAFGIPILPTHHVTSLLERRHLWQQHVQMDGVTRAIVTGRLAYPRTCWRITPSYLPNHKTWKVDEVKVKLGQTMA